MTILGIDPGTALTGYGLITSGKKPECIDYGCIETPKDKDKGQRLYLLAQSLEEILSAHNPDIVAVESLFFAKNTKTAMAVAEAKGVILLSIAKRSLPVHEFSPPQVKMTVTGSGKADKKQVQLMVQRLLSLTEVPTPDDAADGLALAITCGVFLNHPASLE
jgi:crossover junction endodeoxyribonuclease RuvC